MQVIACFQSQHGADATKAEAAFEELVARHLDKLTSYGVRLTRSSSLAEDLSQETWLKVWQSAPHFDPSRGRFTTWLFNILHNQHVDTLRKHKIVYSDERIETQLDPRDLESDHLNAQRFAQFDRALYQISQAQRAALLLTHVQGFSNKEAATILGVSVRALESQLARGRKKLKAKVDKLDRQGHLMTENKGTENKETAE